MRKNIGSIWCAACLALLLAWAAGVAEAAYVVTVQGTKIEGSDIRAKSDGEIILTTPQGTRTFYKGQYLQAVADRPADFDKASKLAAAGSYDEAVKLLEDIILRYRFLEWDNQARKVLPQIYIKKGDHAKAAATYDEIFRANPKAAQDAEMQWSYREALLLAGEHQKLAGILDQLIREGSREDAARAQIMRGDSRRAQNQLEAAAMDYLRTVILFEKEQAVQPEALFKAAQTLEQLRDRRAKDLYKELVDNYSTSPYAQEARSKL